MSLIRQKYPKISDSVTVFLAVVFAIAVSVATVAQYYNFSNPAATDNQYPATPDFATPGASYPNTNPATNPAPAYYNNTPYNNTPPTFDSPVTANAMPSAIPSFTTPSNVAPSNAVPPVTVPTNPAPMNVPTFDPPAGGLMEVPVFQPPQFSTPSQNDGVDPTLLAFNGGISNAYNNPYSGTGQPGGTVPAFQQPGVHESLANQGLVARERERIEDRRRADQQYIDTCHDIRDSKNTDAWQIRMPPYAGPLENRTPGDESSILQVNYLSVKQDDYVYDWEVREKHYFSFSLLDPTRFGERVKVWVGLGPDEEKARKHMDHAVELMGNGHFYKAAQEFEWAAYYAPETALEEDARYHAAECYYRENRFDKAVNQYTKLLTDFPSSPYKTEIIKNTYEIAKTWIKQATEDKVSYFNFTNRTRPTYDTFGHAENALKAIFINCPTDPMADDCVFLLGVGYMQRGRVRGDASYEHAAEYFRQLRDSYANSELVVEAMRLEVICREKAGLGADYDARHIIEARKVAEQLSMQFRTQLPSDQQNELLQMQNQLNEQLAEKLWVTGRFYESRKDYLAARLQYRAVIEQYPATECADRARLRYEQISDRPDELPSDWERIKNALGFRK